MSLTRAAAVMCGLCLTTGAYAATVAYDGFETYTPGTSPIGQNGGTGWTSGWSSNALETSTIEVISRTLTGGSVNGGNQALLLQNVQGGTPSSPTGNAGQALRRSFPDQSGTFYISYLLRAENFHGNEFVSFWVGHSDNMPAAGDGIAEMMGGGIFLDQDGGALKNPFFIRIGVSGGAGTVITSLPASPAPEESTHAFQVVLGFGKTSSNLYSSLKLWVFDANTPMPAVEPAPLASVVQGINPSVLNDSALRVLNVGEDEALYLDEIQHHQRLE